MKDIGMNFNEARAPRRRATASRRVRAASVRRLRAAGSCCSGRITTFGSSDSIQGTRSPDRAARLIPFGLLYFEEKNYDDSVQHNVFKYSSCIGNAA